MPAVKRLARTALAAAIGAAVIGGRFDDRVFARAKFSCEFAGASAMAFGTYDPLSGATLDAQGQVSFRCSNKGLDANEADPQSKKTVRISLSQGSSGSFNRRMFGSREMLNYNIYIDPQRSVVWGDGTGGTGVYTQKAQPNNKVETVPVFGRVFGGQDVRADYYSDNLVVTLDF